MYQIGDVVLVNFLMAQYIRKLHLTVIMQLESAKWSHALILEKGDGDRAWVLALSA